MKILNWSVFLFALGNQEVVWVEFWLFFVFAVVKKYRRIRHLGVNIY